MVVAIVCSERVCVVFTSEPFGTARAFSDTLSGLYMCGIRFGSVLHCCGTLVCRLLFRLS